MIVLEIVWLLLFYSFLEKNYSHSYLEYIIFVFCEKLYFFHRFSSLKKLFVLWSCFSLTWNVIYWTKRNNLGKNGWIETRATDLGEAKKYRKEGSKEMQIFWNNLISKIVFNVILDFFSEFDKVYGNKIVRLTLLIHLTLITIFALYLTVTL